MPESVLPPVVMEFTGNSTKGVAAATKMMSTLDRLGKMATTVAASVDAAWVSINKGAAALEKITASADAAKKSMQGLSRSSNAVAKAVEKAATSAGAGMNAISAAAETMAATVDTSTTTAASGMAALATESRAAATAVRTSTTETEAAGVAAAASGSKVGAMGSKYFGLGAVLSKLKTIGPLSLGAIAVAAMDLGTKFDSSMAMLVTQAGVAQSKIAGLKNGVLDMASKVGFTANALSGALFHVESGFSSMGITSANALKITQTAAEGAAVGHADLIKTTTALTAVMASGYVPITKVGTAMGVLNSIVGSGEMTMDDLTKAFSGGALAVVKGFGATIQDAGAALAVFGDNNIRGASAGTMFRMSVQALAQPVGTATNWLKKFGMTTNTLSKDMQKGGMKLALQDLETRFKQAGITATEQGKVITDMFGKKAGAGISVLLGQYDRTMSKYDEMDKGVNKFAAAWVTTKQTLGQQFKEIEGGIDAVLIRVGEKLVPQVSKFITLLESRGKPVVKSFSDALSGIASGFDSSAPTTPAKPSLGPVTGKSSGGSLFAPRVPPPPPELTAWQKVGQVFKGVTDNLAKFGSQVGTSFKNLMSAAQPTLVFLGGAGLGALQAVAGILANVLGPTLVAVTGFLARHKTLVEGVVLGYVAYRGALLAMTIVTKGVELATKAAAAAQVLWNAALDANPIGATIVIIGALALAAMYCWQHFQGFRNVVMDVFSVTTMFIGTASTKIILMLKQMADASITSVGTMLAVLGHMPGFGWAKQASKDVLGFQGTLDKSMDGLTQKIGATVAWANQQRIDVVMRGQIDDLTKKIADAKKQLSDKNLPPSKEMTLQANIVDWQQKMAVAKMGMQTTPSKKMAVLTATITNWQQQIATAKKQLGDKNLPPAKQVVLTAQIADLSKHVAAAKAELASVKNKTVTITSMFVVKGSAPSVSKFVAAPNANGSISYAAGGLHIPGLRKAADGLMARQAGFSAKPILWGEAGPEAYIPLSKSRQPRSRQIAAQTVGILGGQVSWGGGGKGAQGAMASYSTLGAAIPAGVAAGVSGSAGTAHAAVTQLAKGTVDAFSQELEIASPSKKFKSLGAYVITGLVQGLTGSTASVRAATKRIATYMYEDFGSSYKGTQAVVSKDSKALLSLAAKRDAVATKLKAANTALAAVQKQYAAEVKSVADSIMQSSTVVMDATDNGGWLSATQVVQNFAEQTQKSLQFAGFLKQAQANGLNAAMVQQIAASGVDAGYATAQALSTANKSQIAQLNQMQTQTQSAATGVGDAVADAMYSAGIKSAQGLVKGLQSQEKAIDAQMLKIAKAMQSAIKRALGIKSPSRVFEGLGQYIPQGLAKGINGGTHHATGAVMTMSKAVANAGSNRSYAYAGSQLGGGGGGSTVVQNTYVTVNVAGRVSTERDLVESVRSAMLRKGANNSQTYQPYKR